MQLNNSRPYDSLDWIRECADRGESIVGRIIRERKEADAAKAARLARIRSRIIVANLILWPLACYVTVRLVESLL